MTDTDTTTETDELQQLRELKTRLKREYNDVMDGGDLAYAVYDSLDGLPDETSYSADTAHRLIDIITAAIDAWQRERDAQRPRTQGPVERALREEWGKKGNGRLGEEFTSGRFLDFCESVRTRGDTGTLTGNFFGALLADLGETREGPATAPQLPEGVAWPIYEDGAPVRLGDAVCCGIGPVFKVASVAISASGASLLSEDGRFEESYLFGERVRRYQQDTWGQLREDATLPPASYCDRHDVNLDQGWDPSDAARAMALDLIERAERLARGGE